MNTDNHITALLKASIQHQATTNLLTHKKDDLSLMIELIEKERKDLESSISLFESTIANAEDMSEMVEGILRQKISLNKVKLESLLAWRMIFLDAWSNGGK